jgi:hypothetical protein
MPPLGRRIAAIEPFRQHYARLIEITERLIERPHFVVVGPDHQHCLGDTTRRQPLLGSPHHRAAMAVPLLQGIDREIIKPAAVAIVPDHDRGDDLVSIASGQQGGIIAGERQRDIGAGVVPRPRQLAALPQRDNCLDVGAGGVGDGERRFAYGSTLPGLRMPLGSSSCLMPRIRSSATGSL